MEATGVISVNRVMNVGDTVLARLRGFESLDERFYFFSSMISEGGSAKMGVNRL
jgi:hypothetical protein